MKKSFFILFFLISTHTTFALSPLPKNAYLRFGDRTENVKTLQEILNSDPDTIITDAGAGSPGHESTYFGKLTLVAVKKFQGKNELEETGEVDYKTWEKLNDYVYLKNNPPKNISTQPINIPKNPNTNSPKPNQQNNSDQPEKNIYLDNSPEEKNSQNQNATPTETKSYLDSILDKYFGYFRNSNTPTINPQTGNPNIVAPNNPNQIPAQQASQPQQQIPIPPSGSQSQPQMQQPPQQNFMQRLQNSLLGGLTQSMNNSGASGQVGKGTYDGQTGQRGDKVGITYEEDGWVRGQKATNFGCNDTYAKGYFKGTDNANSTAMQGFSVERKLPIDTDCNLFLVGIPIEVQKYFFGNLPLEQLYKKDAGTPIEVVNLNNQNCTVVPLWESGPGKNEAGSIDLTNAVKLLLGSKPGDNFPVRYRPVKNGETGCSGYNFMDPNNKGLHIPTRR